MQKWGIFMDIDAAIIYKIIGNHCRFITPFSEPYGYYIFEKNPQETAKNPLYDLIREEQISFYLNKLEYAAQHADFLIEQAFHASYYEFIKNHQFVKKNPVLPQSPHDMCQQLIFDSFVLALEEQEIQAALSNTHFMFGHFIDCRWDYDWNLLSSYIC